MWYVWFLLGGFVGGVLHSLFLSLFMTSGTLKIDHSNPLKDIYRFDIDRFERLSKAKRVILKVDHDAYLSQK